MCEVNKQAATTLPNIALSEAVRCLKPDIVVKNMNVVYLIDVACPYDLYIENAFLRKKVYYEPLAAEISRSGFTCQILPLIVGSCGIIHRKCLPYLIKLGLPKKQAKGLCKYSCNSNILFARNIWSRRCSLIFDV